MTITRRWQCGFETGSADEISGGRFDSETVCRTGACSNRVFPHDANPAYRNFYQNVPATKQVRLGFAFRANSLGTSDGRIVIIYSGATRLVELFTVQATSDIALYIQTVQEDVTINSPLTLHTWHHLAIDCKIDAVSGWAKAYLNGIEILSFAGDTSNIDIDKITFGCLGDLGVSAIWWYYDDCYIDDTTGEGSASAPPILRFDWILPNADGNYSQWVGSDGNSVNNYLLVDERPPNGADYVETDTVDQFDSYGMTTVTLVDGQVFEAVIPIVYAQRYGVAEEIAVGLRYASTDVLGSDEDPGFGAWSFVWDRQTTKPGGGAWDQTAVDGVESVIKSRGTF